MAQNLRGKNLFASGHFHPLSQHLCHNILPLVPNLRRLGDTCTYRTIHRSWNPRWKLDSLGQISSSNEPGDIRHDTSTSRRFVDEGIKSHFLRPHVYCPLYCAWMPLKDCVEALRRGHVLSTASWNLHFNDSGVEARTSAAISHLRTIFGQKPHDVVIMLQEVCPEALDTILNNGWARKNFTFTDIEPPDCLYGDDDFFYPELLPRGYFTLMMISKTLPISNCFRVPFRSETRRDALVVDIPIVSEGGAPNQSEGSVLRLCTTHLESMERGNEYRFPQLSIVSALLKGKFSRRKRVHAGLVGGDMNSILVSEHGYHRAPEIDLRDIWEDEPASKPPILKPSEKDLTYGRAKGNTWGYQSEMPYQAKRLDKFYCTGSIETLAVSKAQDVIGKVGRFGIGLQTVIGTNYRIWVSDHFGITVVIKVI